MANGRTLKKYLVLDTTTDVNLDKCKQHGGILPEPRSQEENEFLNNLNSDTFVLGMNNKETEGTSLVWDSDGTPVVYQRKFDRPKSKELGFDQVCSLDREYTETLDLQQWLV